MIQDADLIVPWLAISNFGLWCLVALLITYACAPWLPQRNNAYLVNFVLTTLICVIPPSLLFYSGYQYKPIPSRLCMAQASLVIGIAPLFATGQLALVFDTWSELRSLCIHKKHISRIPFVKCIALIFPYFSFGFWSFAASQATLVSSLNVPGHDVPTARYVFCRVNGPLADHINRSSGFFILIVTAVQILFEVWVAWMIYAYPCKVQDDPTTWRTNIQFSLRVIILSMLQLLTVFLNVLNSDTALQNIVVKLAFELLTSMNALVAFIVVGLQSNVLLTWKHAFLCLWDIIRRKKPENPDELQPQGYPVLDWAYVPSKYESATSATGSAEHPLNRSMELNTDLGSEERGVGLGGARIAYPKFLSRLKIGGKS